MMNTKNRTRKDSAEKTVRDIRRATRRNYSAEEKIRIVLEGLRGEDSIAELCRKEGINQNLYYRWSKEFLEAGKRRLAGNVVREADLSPVMYATSDVGFPYKMTDGRSRHEAQALYRRTDNFDPQGA